jgi:hypothetical protein
VSAGEGRRVAELLDNRDGMACEALLDMSADRALGMVRGWLAAELWAVLRADPTVSANGDPIAILAAMGRAVGRSLAMSGWMTVTVSASMRMVTAWPLWAAPTPRWCMRPARRRLILPRRSTWSLRTR